MKPLFHVHFHFVNGVALVAEHFGIGCVFHRHVLFRDSRLGAERLQKFRVARIRLFHQFLFQFRVRNFRMRGGECDVCAVVAFNRGDIRAVDFVERILCAVLSVKLRLEFEFPIRGYGFLRVAVLREGEFHLRVLLENFRVAGGFRVLFALEIRIERVERDFIFFLNVRAERVRACDGGVSQKTDGGDGDFHKQVHERLENDSAVRELRIMDVALDGNVEVDFPVLVLYDVESELERNFVFRLRVLVLVARFDVEDIDGVLAFDVVIAEVVVACEGERACGDGIACIMQTVGREFAEVYVFERKVRLECLGMPYTFKIQENSLNNQQKEFLKMIFIEQKWLKNYILNWCEQDKENKLTKFNTKIIKITHKDKDMNDVE